MMKHEASSRRSRSPSSQQASSTLSIKPSSSKGKAPPTYGANASSSRQDLLTTSGYPPETKLKEPASEKQTGKTIDAPKGNWSERIKGTNSGIAIDSPTEDDLKKEQEIRNTIIESNVSKFLQDKAKSRGGNIAFAECKIDGKDYKINSLSCREKPNKQLCEKLKGFAPFFKNDERQLKAIKASAPGKPGEGYLRDGDTEGKILEQIIRQTTDKSAGTIRLFTQRLVCDSCGDVIEQFKKERPYIEITVVERET